MTPQLQNWHNFCLHHTGDWYSQRTRYSPEGEKIKSWQAISYLHLNEERDEISHQEELTYTNGNKELKDYGIYKKPITSSLFLDNSFCWGTKQLEYNSIFIFEIGLRFENRRILCYTKYNNKGEIEYISTAVEYLNNKVYNQSTQKKMRDNWQGNLKKITPDWIVSQQEESLWKPLGELNKDYITLELNECISVSCPQIIEKRKAFFIAVDWQVNPILLQRGIGYYDSSHFTHFTLESFKPVVE
ncbi:MAG: DUF3598 family protein [Moorea sp. SIO2B7]|nr:DUF3598 family protein [Moorena sp. SIO2B7]